MSTGALPRHWKMVTLEDVAAPIPNAIVDGPFGSNLKLDDYVPEGVPVLQGKNITDDSFRWLDVRFISRRKADELKRSSVRVGDILIVKIGSIGYSAVLDDLNGFDHAIIPANLAKVTPDLTKVDIRYLHRWLTSTAAKQYLMRVASKTAQPALSLGKIKDLPVPLPSRQEQRRIAEILDKADALRAKRRAALTQLDSLTQSIFLDMFGDPATNPKGCTTKSLTSVCHCYSGGTPSKRESRYWEGHLPWFSPKDLKQDDLFDSEDHVNEAVPSETNLKLLSANTVAIVVRGMILAHTFPVSVIRVPATINQDLKALLPKNGRELDPQFLAHCLRVQSRAILASVSESAHGTKRLDAEALAKIAVALPSRESQREFSRLVARAEQWKVAQRTSLRQLDLLFASLQHRAFRGDLWPGFDEISEGAHAFGS